MSKDWNKIEHSKKGIKGFQSVPKEKKKINYTAVNFTTYQKAVLKDFCNKYELSMSEVIREAVFEYLSNRDHLKKYAPEMDKRQMKFAYYNSATNDNS